MSGADLGLDLVGLGADSGEDLDADLGGAGTVAWVSDLDGVGHPGGLDGDFHIGIGDSIGTGPAIGDLGGAIQDRIILIGMATAGHMPIRILTPTMATTMRGSGTTTTRETTATIRAVRRRTIIRTMRYIPMLRATAPSRRKVHRSRI